LNQSYYSKEFYVSQPLSSRNFPNWGVVNTRVTGANAYYNAAQIELGAATLEPRVRLAE